MSNFVVLIFIIFLFIFLVDINDNLGKIVRRLDYIYEHMENMRELHKNERIEDLMSRNKKNNQ